MDIPTRPALRPGRHVLRRGPATLQVGLDARHALTLPDSPAVRRTLAALRVAAPAGDADREVLATLASAGLLVDAADLPPSRCHVAAEHGRDTQTMLARRTGTRVRVDAFGASGLPDPTELLGSAGLRTTTSDPDVVLVAGVGEPPRERLDPWVRAGTPHLLVRITEGDAVVGPFVVPGRTACLRCIDGHLADDEPPWPLLVAQQAEQTSRLRADGCPEPVDPVLAQLATAWAVRDLVSFVDGATPSSWSATVRLPPRLAETEAVAWLRHPGCGCWWDDVPRSG